MTDPLTLSIVMALFFSAIGYIIGRYHQEHINANVLDNYAQAVKVATAEKDLAEHALRVATAGLQNERRMQRSPKDWRLS